MAGLTDTLMQSAGSTSTVSVSGTSAQSSAISVEAKSHALVRVVSTTNCHLAFGNNPTATTSNLLLPAFTVEYFKMNTGDKIAAIQNSASGTLYISPMV